MGEGPSYEPVSVKEVLVEMKDTAELLVDLSFSSVLFDSEALADAVLELESEMDLLQMQARMSLVMAGRRPTEAEQLASVFGIVGAAEKISDAAGDVAKVVREEIELPPAFRSSLPEALETFVRVTVAPESAYAGLTLAEADVESQTGVRVLAIGRNDEWLVGPGREATVRPGDVLLCRGPESGVETVHETTTGDRYDPPAAGPDPPANLARAVETLALMKSTSELAVDLAYGSVLFDSEALADEVRRLEVEVDAQRSRFEAWVLQAAADAEDPVSLRGLIHIAAAAETISDAALEISEGVLRGVGSHPVVEAAVGESSEVIVRETVAAGSDLEGTTVAEVYSGAATGVEIVAIRRSSDDEVPPEYVLSPPSETVLRTGDVVVAAGTRAGAERLAAMAAT
jgi:uncharacterized protein with PhoU and TrkA domain